MSRDEMLLSLTRIVRIVVMGVAELKLDSLLLSIHVSELPHTRDCDMDDIPKSIVRSISRFSSPRTSVI